MIVFFAVVGFFYIRPFVFCFFDCFPSMLSCLFTSLRKGRAARNLARLWGIPCAPPRSLRHALHSAFVFVFVLIMVLCSPLSGCRGHGRKGVPLLG